MYNRLLVFRPVCTPHMHYYYDSMKNMHKRGYYNIFIHVCIWKWAKVGVRDRMGGSLDLRGEGGGYLAFGDRWQCLPETAFGRTYLAQMCDSVCVSDGGSRVSIAGGGATRSGVHRGHGDGGRRKRTWCERPTLFDAYFAERLRTGTSESHVLVTVGDGQ